MSDLLTQRDILSRFKVGRSTLWRWLHRGLFPKPKATIGIKKLWTLAQVERFLERGGKAVAR